MNPISPEQFQALVIKSKLIDPDRLRKVWKDIPSNLRTDAGKMAAFLVKQRFLTEFQALKLLKGIRQGLVLGKYRILSPIGRGGMGTVYLARHENGSLVALKVLPPKRAKREERTLARFLREMELSQRVKHPNLARTHEVGTSQGIYFIAMEYIRGKSLKQLVVDEGPLSVDRASALFIEVSVGLAYAHARGLIHRDLKPSNIMVTPAGHAKILDFGLAMESDEEIPEDKTIIGGKGYVVGTMDFIAPEQIQNSADVDFRADLYALGCTMYYTLTGQPPFPGGSSKRKMKMHLTEFPEPIPEINPEVPEAFARIAEKLMEKDPSRRYQNADAVCEAIMPWSKDDQPVKQDDELSNTAIIEEVTHTKMHYWREIGTTLAAVVPSESGSQSTSMPNLELSEDEGEKRESTNKIVWNQKITNILLLVLSLLMLIIIVVLIFRQ
ncbi:serine/threonine protein kinase [Telmatocola sphagniphila]|uniref:Serine/threonine protein kinase n=1 Tax=Telmatocola sphagniphila TaxID=1123043 RepID=A0A8E6B2Y8_9BACT|nr:serine/threonine-protein kinase [Telmatocola sphagniphila]QVL30897.1 serine/threonine protein kinase [Telmatocola sphagniphila]